MNSRLDLTNLLVNPLASIQHDATPTICTFNLTVLDTLRGLAKAREHKFFDFENFNLSEYEYYEQVCQDQ
jgi:hypothetical protein